MINISRRSGYTDNLRDYEIYIDDNYYAKIKDSETKQIDIPNGYHSIYLKIDWCKSNTLTFVSDHDKLLEFDCGNSMSGLKRLLIFFYISIWRDKYLFIKLKN